MFDFSCNSCPAYKSQIAFARCVKEGTCWLGAHGERHPVDHIMHEMGLGPHDITEQPVIVLKNGELKPEPIKLNQRGKIVMNLARVLAMQRRKVRLDGFRMIMNVESDD